MSRIALKGLAGRPLRTALTTLAIVLGVALVSGALTLTDTMGKGADALSSASYDGTDAVVSAPTAFEVDSSEDWALQRPTVDPAVLDRVRDVPGVAAAVGDVTDMQARIVGKDGEPIGDGPYFGVGYDAGTPGTEQLTPFRLEEGRWATGPGQVVIDAATAEDEGFALGDSVSVSTRGEARDFTVVGVARFGEVKSLGTATAAVFDLETAQELFAKRGAYDGILVAAEQGTSGAQLRRDLAASLGGAAQVQTAAEHDRFTLDGLEQFISIIRIVLLVFGGVAILVGALTIVNSLSITVAQRSRELGLMRLVGASRRQLLGAVVGEAVVIGLIGSVVGLVAGFALAKGLDGVFASLGLDLPEAGMEFAARTIVVGLVVGVLVTLVAGIVPALRASRVSPIEALQDADPAAHTGGRLGRLLRPVVSLLARPAERMGGAAGMLARRNSLRHPGRTAATALALTIGVALVTLVSVVAQGLRETTEASIDQRALASHVVTGEDGWSPTDPAIVRALRGAPGVEGVTAIKQDVALAFGDHERVNAIDPQGGKGLVGFDFASGAATGLEQLGTDGAIVDEGWAEEHALGVGDRFSMTSASGERLRLQVRGIEASPVLDGLDQGPITITQQAFSGAFAAERNALTLVEATSGAAVAAALRPFPDADAKTKEAFIADRTADIDTLLAIFGVLLALAVIVSLFGIVNALVLATFERRRELGMLQAVGMTRRQVRRMVRHESIVTALLGATTGVAAGLVIAGVVTAAFAGAGLAFAVPVTTLVVMAVVAVIAGVLAAVLPARRAARLSPLAALAYE